MKKYIEYLFENTTSSDLMNMYFKDKITLDSLIKKAGGIHKIATKKELESALKIKMMINMAAQANNVDPKIVKAKIKEILIRMDEK
jgi:hypothetical protein